MKILKYIAICILTLAFVILPYQMTIGKNNEYKNTNKDNFFVKILKYELHYQDKNTIETTSQNFNLGEFIISSTLPENSAISKPDNHYEIKYDFTSIENSSTNNGNPKVVIYHTHTTESYWNDANPSVYRSEEMNKNMVLIGSIVAKILHDEYGIDVIHVKDIFDMPYTGAYYRSEDAILNIYKQNPGLIYAFDIHRDGLNPSEENRNAYLTNINGINCAKVMIVLGLKSDYADANVALAYKVAEKTENMYPGMFKRIIERNSDYNQYITPKSLLFEIGSNLSTTQEAMNTSVYLARVLGEIITEELNQK